MLRVHDTNLKRAAIVWFTMTVYTAI
jgi:hypothetical protein